MIILKARSRLGAALVFFLLLLSGCADRVAERRGTQLDVVPVSYSLSLKIKPKQNRSAEKELNQFLLDNKKLILTQHIELVWKTKIGKLWADKSKERLLNDGVNKKNISVIQGKAGFNGRFDYQINITVHKVLLTVCPYPKNSHYSEAQDGCYTESARWQSMVNPQKMLKQSLNAEHTNK